MQGTTVEQDPSDLPGPPATAGAETQEKQSSTTRARILEIISAILLSFATVASAWCAYQSARWGGVQALALSSANAARTESVRASNEALQLTSIDVSLFTQFVTAYSEDNQVLASFLLERFRDEMKPAMDAWLATEPAKNPNAPPSPFAMPEYQLASRQKADELLQVAADKVAEAEAANQTGDNYVLLTVMFASVLFFGGISTKFDSINIRTALLSFTIVFFVIALSILVTYPIE